jgi:hypothetical protein
MWNTPDSKGETIVAEREQIYNNMDTAPILYVNSVQIAQSQFDIRLMVGSLDVADDTRIVTRVSAIVYMTVQHAKILTDLLTKHIAKYEAVNGPIVLHQIKSDESTEAKTYG